MASPSQSPLIISLCSGILGIERGLERAFKRLDWTPHTTAAYVEIESWVCWNLVKQMEQGLLAPAPVHTNIKRFPFREFRNKIHGIIGGYPCQPFSLAGERKGDKDPRHLWPFIYRGIQTVQPIFCFFENVAGHLSSGFCEVSRDLRKVGYRVEAGIFTAEEVGAPHQRERLFILAISDASVGGFGWGKTTEDENREPESRESRNMEIRSERFCSMANAGEIRLSGPVRNGELERRFRFTECSEQNRWPSNPGQPQHSWEAPRVESRLGCTVNGYNHREDLLRSLGNGVVEQTAELAFLTLLEKFK